MPPQYTNITYDEMKAFLTSQGFKINIGTSSWQEDSYDKIIQHNGMKFAIRVYTSISFSKSRDVGKDAIRVVIFLVNKAGGYIKISGDKRVNRTQNWRDNLQKRINTWIDDAVWCNYCGMPMVVRKNKRDNTKFYGCISYPDCRGTKPYE